MLDHHVAGDGRVDRVGIGAPQQAGSSRSAKATCYEAVLMSKGHFVGK